MPVETRATPRFWEGVRGQPAQQSKSAACYWNELATSRTISREAAKSWNRRRAPLWWPRKPRAGAAHHFGGRENPVQEPRTTLVAAKTPCRSRAPLWWPRKPRTGAAHHFRDRGKPAQAPRTTFAVAKTPYRSRPTFWWPRKARTGAAHHFRGRENPIQAPRSTFAVAKTRWRGLFLKVNRRDSTTEVYRRWCLG